ERREQVQDVDGCSGEEALLANQLDEIGDRLEKTERAGAVRAIAERHPPHRLPLRQRQVREGEEDEVHDHERLDDRDPPRLAVHVQEEGRHALSTSTVGWSSPACSSAMRTTPCISCLLSFARSARLVPFERTSTRSPSRI